MNHTFKITPDIRAEVIKIFETQYNAIQDKTHPLFIFDHGEYASVRTYYERFSFTENNVVYSADNKPLMSIFAFTGKNSLRLDKLLGKKNLVINGLRVFKNCKIPLHVDANHEAVGREKPIYSIVLTDGGVIYFSNKRDGSKLVAIPGMSEFIMSATEIEHGAHAGDCDMDMLQIRLENDL
jgi:hypothetical protein